MSKFGVILKHFGLSKRRRRSVKKVIRRTENDKKTKNAGAYALPKTSKNKPSVGTGF